MAYPCGWPLVNVANRAAAFAKALETGLLGDGVGLCSVRSAEPVVDGWEKEMPRHPMAP